MNVPPPGRLSDRLLAGAQGTYRALVTPTEPGVAAGLADLSAHVPAEVRALLRPCAADGDRLLPGQPLLSVEGPAALVALAEDHVLGPLGFACGVATNARRFADAAPPGLRVVCGAWKKLPTALKPLLRSGLDAAGVGHRLLPGNFLYVDKNAVTMLGGVARAVAAGLCLDVGPVAIQLKDATCTAEAVHAGCSAVMVDTGSLDDLAAAHHALRHLGREDVVLAYAGGLGTGDLAAAHRLGAQVVDIGRGILASPLLDLRLDVAV